MATKRKERIEGALRKAMLDLLQKKTFDQITVAQVADEAGVSKSTLYAHYQNLYALVQDCYLHDQIYFGPAQKRRADYTNRHDAVCETLQVTAKRLLFFKNNPNLAKVILNGEGFSPEFDQSEQMEEDLHVDHLQFEYGVSTEDFIRYAECGRYIQAGYEGMIRQWFAAGATESVERVAKSMVYYSLCVTAGTVGHAIEPEYKEAIERWHFEEQ